MEASDTPRWATKSEFEAPHVALSTCEGADLVGSTAEPNSGLHGKHGVVVERLVGAVAADSKKEDSVGSV